MKPNTNGQAQPDLIKEATDVPKTKTRTYTNARTGETHEFTEAEFMEVVELFKHLRKMRDDKDTQPDDLEPNLFLELDPQDKNNNLKRKAG